MSLKRKITSFTQENEIDTPTTLIFLLILVILIINGRCRSSPKIAKKKKAKNPCRCSKIPLHKKFKLILEQNVREQTYPEMTFRLQK